MNKNTQSFLIELSTALKSSLPAAKAHVKLAPDDRIEGLLDRVWPSNAKQSAVTFLLFIEEGELKTLLMKRVESDGVHSGQISFPGGQKDAQDNGLLDTAIREFYEETGVDLAEEDFLGALSDLYIPPSNFLVQPYIAYLPSLPKLRPELAEVQELHKVSLSELFNPKNFKEEEILVRQRSKNSYSIKAPCYKIRELCIWGATAMMISELQMIVEKIITENPQLKI